MNFYDIGANIGFFSLFAARLVGEHGHVTAFEADPENAARLREHIARNKLPQIAVEEKAVWSERGTVIFARTDPTVSPDRGTGHIASAAGPATIQVAAVSLDEYTSISPAPDFIKCDVEGAELEVFRGARRLLREKRPGIVCEMHGEENRRTLIGQFSRAGYQCKSCGEGHVLALPE
jgi:FkbM family methyltransferase